MCLTFIRLSFVRWLQNQRRLELNKFHIGFRLSSYLYFLVTKKGIRLQVEHESFTWCPHPSPDETSQNWLRGSHFFISVDACSPLPKVSDDQSTRQVMVGQQQPTLGLLCQFLNIVTNALERGADEKSLLLNKVRDSLRWPFPMMLTSLHPLYYYKPVVVNGCHEFLDTRHKWALTTRSGWCN